MSTLTIPKAGIIEVDDPPEISSVEFIKQVVDNIGAQMLLLDTELERAAKGDAGHVSIAFICAICGYFIYLVGEGFA